MALRSVVTLTKQRVLPILRGLGVVYTYTCATLRVIEPTIYPCPYPPSSDALGPVYRCGATRNPPLVVSVTGASQTLLMPSSPNRAADRVSPARDFLSTVLAYHGGTCFLSTRRRAPPPRPVHAALGQPPRPSPCAPAARARVVHAHPTRPGRARARGPLARARISDLCPPPVGGTGRRRLAGTQKLRGQGRTGGGRGNHAGGGG